MPGYRFWALLRPKSRFLPSKGIPVMQANMVLQQVGVCPQGSLIRFALASDRSLWQGLFISRLNQSFRFCIRKEKDFILSACIAILMLGHLFLLKTKNNALNFVNTNP